MELIDLVDILVQDTDVLNTFINRSNVETIVNSRINRSGSTGHYGEVEFLTRQAAPKKGIPSIDIAFKELCRFIGQYDADFRMPRFVDRVVPEKLYKASDVVVIPFSGGKVSLALAVRYKNMGVPVHLYHIHNEYTQFGREQLLDDVKKQAEELQLPLHIETTYYKFFDRSVLKHLIILSRALYFAIEHGYKTDIIYGTFESGYMNGDIKDNVGCAELTSIYKSILRKFCSKARIVMPFPNYSVVWDELINTRRVLPYLNCSGAIDSRVMYIAKIDHGIEEEKDTSIYMKHIRYLKKTLGEEAGDINKLWNRYFFYRIEKSKHYGELMKLSK